MAAHFTRSSIEYYLDGAALTAGDSVDSDGIAGTWCILEYRASGEWTLFEGEGDFTDGGPS